MINLVPYIQLTLLGSVILAVCNLYIYMKNRETPLLLWGISWGFCILRYIFMLLFNHHPEYQIFFALNQFFACLNGIFLLYGVFVFVNKSIPRLWLFLFPVFFLWDFISVYLGFNPLLITLPNFLFLGIAYIATGFYLIKTRNLLAKERYFIGILFIIWGIHKLDYPFLYRSAWFAPIGYSLAFIFMFFISFGLIVLYFSETKIALQKSTRKFNLLIEKSKIPIIVTDDKFNDYICNTFLETAFNLKDKTEVKEFLDKVREELKKAPDFLSSITNFNYYQYSNFNFEISEKLKLHYLIQIIKLESQLLIYFIDQTAFENIRHDRNRLMSAINDLDEMIVVLDREKKIIYINPAYEKITGYKFIEKVGEYDLVNNLRIINRELNDQINHVLDQGEPWQGLINSYKKNNEQYIVDFSIKPVYNRRGELVNYISVKKDITEQKRIQEHMNTRMRFESLTRLTSGIAHDLNNFLFPVMGYADLLLEDPELRGSSRNYVSTIKSAASKSRDLLNRLLLYGKSKEVVFEKVSVNNIIMGLERIINSMVNNDIEVDFNLGEVKDIFADSNQIEQIIMNLIINARDAITGKGTIVIGTRLIEEAEDGGSGRGNEYVELRVTDTGTGIEEKLLDKIFDPFFSTKGEKGTGLGLSTVFGIVETHNGKIYIDSVPGKGTVFKVLLQVFSPV